MDLTSGMRQLDIDPHDPEVLGNQGIGQRIVKTIF